MKDPNRTSRKSSNGGKEIEKREKGESSIFYFWSSQMNQKSIQRMCEWESMKVGTAEEKERRFDYRTLRGVHEWVLLFIFKDAKNSTKPTTAL